MDSELFRYIAEQSGGVLIAIILINHVENKLDSLTREVSRLTDTLAGHLLSEARKLKVAKSEK